MSFAQIQAASVLAQRTLAQYMGMSEDAPGNALINGGKYTLVFGKPRIAEDMNAGGGYRPKVVIDAIGTKSQFGAAPISKEMTVTRIDVTPPVTYRIDTLDTHDSINYEFVLMKVGT